MLSNRCDHAEVGEEYVHTPIAECQLIRPTTAKAAEWAMELTPLDTLKLHAIGGGGISKERSTLRQIEDGCQV